MERRVCGCGLRPKSKEERNLELRKDAARIVAGVENYSGTDHTRREAELKAAFPPVAKTSAKTTAKSAAKPAAKPAAKSAAKAKIAAKPVAKKSSKGPTPAGMSVGRHDGDLC